MASIKKNFLYNLILTGGNYIFPLITYPYVSRVLGVEKIGVCNFVDSIINYFVLFAALGVGSLGCREIARVKDDKIKMSETFSSLASFNILLTLIAIFCLIFVIYYVPSLSQYRPFLFIGISKLLLSAFLIEWFFQGISDFKYVTIRSLFVKSIYVVSTFLFIHDINDAEIYYLLTCMLVVLNAVINWYYSKKFVTFSLKGIHWKIFIIPILSYGFYRILTSMYTSFNVLYLGLVTNDTQVGYFVTATKLYSILMSVFTAFTTVMVPKVSELIGKGDVQRLTEIADKTFDIVFACTIPILIICWCYAPLIIYVIAGKGYEGAITPFRIVMILFIVIALEQIIIQQFLMAIRESKCILILSSSGAFVGVLLNILLVDSLQCIGSAIAWSVSEISILAFSLFFFHKYLKMFLPYKKLMSFVILYIPYIGIFHVMGGQEMNINLALSLLAMGVWFYIVNVKIMKVEIFTSLNNRLLKYIQ